jgi:ABC-type transport system involved in multi-copper enzyme maturation permease subunit
VIKVIRAEWLKLRTTAVPWVLGAIAMVINGLLILVIFLNHGSNGGGPFGGGGGNDQTITIGPSYPHTVQQLRNLVGSGFAGYLLALLLGVLIVTTEFRHKTVTTAFLITPIRPVMVGGKLLMAAIAGAGLAIVMFVTSMVGGGLTLIGVGGSYSSLLHQVPAVLPGMVLVFILFGMLGVGIGSVLTNQVAAIVVTLGWFIILEGILVSLVHGAARWVPTGAAEAAANINRSRTGVSSLLFNWWEGSLLIIAYGLVFAAVGSYILTRRDIT